MRSLSNGKTVREIRNALVAAVAGMSVGAAIAPAFASVPIPQCEVCDLSRASCEPTDIGVACFETETGCRSEITNCAVE